MKKLRQISKIDFIFVMKIMKMKMATHIRKEVLRKIIFYKRITVLELFFDCVKIKPISK